MNNKTVVILLLAILALSTFAMIPIKPVSASDGNSKTLTLPDAELMIAEFATKNWGPGTVQSRTDVAGPGVQFNFTGLGPDSGTGVKDDWEVNPLAGGALYSGHYCDFTRFSRYSMCIKNTGTGEIKVCLFMNTGFTSEHAWRDTFWQGAWVTVAPGACMVATLDFSASDQAWSIADDEEFTGHSNGDSGIPVWRLNEVTALGFQVMGVGAGSIILIDTQLYIDPPVVIKYLSDVCVTDFTVSVTLFDFANLMGFDIKLTWDGTLIPFVSTDKTPLDALWPSGWTTLAEQSGAGYYKLAAMSATAASASNPGGSSVLFKVTFHVAKNCNFPLSTSIHFDLVKLCDNTTPTPEPICAVVTDGMYYMNGVTKPDLEIVVVPVTGHHGPPFEECDTFELEVWVTHICPDSPLTDYTIIIQYGTHLAKYLDVDRWNTGFGIKPTGVESPNGTITVSCVGGPTSGNSFFVFALTFHVEFGFEDAHIWKKGLPNYEEFNIALVDATLSFARGTITKTGINMPSDPVTIRVNFIRGDVNCDGKVNIEDISDATYSYDKKDTDPDWDTVKKYDLNDDKVIDIFDFVTIATNYGYGMPNHWYP
jgi:hypothetical protein